MTCISRCRLTGPCGCWTHFPQADRDVCLLAILLHDIGWWAIDMDTILAEGFRGPNILQSDVRYRHEAEGVRLATEVLRQDRLAAGGDCASLRDHRRP